MGRVGARVILDTDVMVAALRSSAGASRQLLIGALEQRYVLLLSVPLMIEYEAVMKRSQHLAAARASEADIDEILDALAAVGTAVRPAFSWRPMLSDPADEMVLETAINGEAGLIVTFNLRHLGPAARRFGIDAARPHEALELLEVGR